MGVRLVLLPLAALVALAISGCGGSGDGATDPASVAPPTTPFYMEVAIRPDAGTAEAVDALAETIAGVDDLGELIVAEIEFDEPVDFTTDVEPWLGERIGLSLREFDGDDFFGYDYAVQVTDEAAAREFVMEQLSGDDGVRWVGHDGVDFAIDPEDGSAVGVFDELVVLTEDRRSFEEAVDAGAGTSLADSAVFADATDPLPDDAFANLYVDVGGLIDDSGGVDAEDRVFFEIFGLQPGEATVAASLIPSADSLELDLSTDAIGGDPTDGDVTALLGSLPGDSAAALAVPGFGAGFGALIDRVDENGIPDSVPPNQFKDALKVAGIDSEALAAAIGGGAAFVVDGEDGIAAALLLEAADPDEAADAVADLGAFLGNAEIGVIGQAGEGLTGFSLRSPDLGEEPLIFANQNDRVTIAYGYAAAVTALRGGGETLADDAGFQAAAEALGDTPISAYLKGPPALRLADSLIGPGDEDFEAARPYLENVDYVAVGSGADGDRTTAKVIVGVGE